MNFPPKSLHNDFIIFFFSGLVYQKQLFGLYELMPPRNWAEDHLTYPQSKGNDCQVQMNQATSALVKFKESWN